MKSHLETEIAEEQHGFRAGRGTRDQALNFIMIIEKNREQTKNVYLCFIDYRKAFDTVLHEILWHEMKKMGFPTQILILIMNLYEQQQAVMKTAYGLSERLSIGKGAT